MRFHQTLQLEKLRAEREELEEKEQELIPIRQLVNQQYIHSKAWHDPVARSFGRIGTPVKKSTEASTTINQTTVHAEAYAIKSVTKAHFSLAGSVGSSMATE